MRRHTTRQLGALVKMEGRGVALQEALAEAVTVPVSEQLEARLTRLQRRDGRGRARREDVDMLEPARLERKSA